MFSFLKRKGNPELTGDQLPALTGEGALTEAFTGSPGEVTGALPRLSGDKRTPAGGALPEVIQGHKLSMIVKK